MIYYEIWSSTLIQKQLSLNCKDIYKSYILQSISENLWVYLESGTLYIYIYTTP